MNGSAPQTPTSPILEPSKHRQLPWLAFVLSLLVLSVIAALAFQNLKLKKQISSITPPTGGSQITPKLSPQTDATSACNVSVDYPSGWAIDNTQYSGSNYPDVDSSCISILSPEYLANIKQVKGPGSAYMGFEITISRTKIGSVFKNIAINNLGDYLTSQRNIWEPPAELSSLEVKDKTIGTRKGKSYILGGMGTWRNFIFTEGEYIYKVSYPVNSDGTSISPYDKEVDSMIESIQLN